MPESVLLPVYSMMVEAEPDLSTFENKSGLAEDMKFLASMPELCDVTFLVGDTREPVCAVKAVLAARSRVFHKMLYQAPSPQRKKESAPRENKLRLFLKRSSEPLLNLQNASQQPSSQQHQTLIIEEFEPDVFRQLIEYIHTGCVTLQPRTLLGVMNAADYYGLDELRKACAGFVQCCINVDTVCALLASAERYIQYKCTKSLVQKVLEFVDEHGNEVLNLGSFTLLPQHVVRLILARDELQADEFTKFQAALMWGMEQSQTSTHRLRSMIESVSKRAFTAGSSSGTYHVHALELAAAARVRRHAGLCVRVHFLDATEHEFHIDKRAKGTVLLTLVYQHLELVEKDYFGLQYCTDGGSRSTGGNGAANGGSNGVGNSSNCRSETMRWLDAGKTVKKQLGSSNERDLYFRVKFYVNDPSKLQEEYTRYQFYLQVRNDIMDGRLVLPVSTACLLSSYTVQSELGDYHPDDHGSNYLSNLRLMPGQTEDMEGKISELHKLHKGQMPADAEFNFLDHAKRMDMYGVELHRAKDNTDKDLLLGVTANGLVVFQANIRINTFSWSKIMKISFKRKHFFIQLRREPSENYDTVLGFNMETYRSSKTLWKACVEHHTFFRLHSPKVRRRFPLSLGSKFAYSGRTEFQTVTEVKQRGRLERKFVRSPSKALIKYNVQAPALEDKGKTLVAPARPPRPYDNKVTSLGSKEPRKAWEEDDIRISDDDGGFLEKTLEGPFSPGIAGRVLSYADEEPSPTGVEGESEGGGLYDTPPYSAGHSPTTSHLLLGEDGLVTILLHPDADGKYGFNVKGGSTSEEPILVSRVAPNTPADKCTPRLTEGDQLILINGQDVSNGIHADVVQIIQEARATPTGKLVLTVRPNAMYTVLDGYEEPPYQYVPVGEILRPPSPGNALEQSMLLLADNLASGALVTQYDLLHRKHPDMTCDEASKMKNINKNRYRDISPYDSTRVVLLNGPNGGDYINANHVIMRVPTNTPTTSPPSPTPNANEILNRYIATQGPLQSTSDDFWTMVYEQNCRLIVMLTTVIERGRAKCHKYWPNVGDAIYIGGTGSNAKLKVECVHEDGTEEGVVYRNLVLTDIKTNISRSIRHMQYTSWPDHGVPDNPIQFLSFTERVREERHKITPPQKSVDQSMPSIKSPKESSKSPSKSSSKSSKCSSASPASSDKESTPPDLVPDVHPATIDYADNIGADAPVVVHCSAGIGRTGVLVLMETALCLMEVGQPVYPLDIVQTMRKQRAMMIQNASQYKFVCESVQMAYTQKII